MNTRERGMANKDGCKRRMFVSAATISVMLFFASTIATSSYGIWPVASAQMMTQQNNNMTSSESVSNQNMTSNATAMHTNDTMAATAANDTGDMLRLSHANIAIDIPLNRGYVNGSEVFYITTDVSNKTHADILTNNTGFPVNFAPLLGQAPDEAVANIYIFTNGMEGGDGTLGFQPSVADSQPGDSNYSPLWKAHMVEWQNGADVRELRSEQEILQAQENGELVVTETDVVVNCPFVQWEGGSMMIRQNQTVAFDSSYGGGQVLDINTENMTATFVAHRGWDPDGNTIYYIVTDATPEMPANMMGVTYVPKDAELMGTAAAPALFQFMNGIKGTGPMGFQSGIGASGPTDANYSPMWTISFIEWQDPSEALVLETLADISAMQQDGMITTTPAMGGMHVVNCPFFTQETVFEHQNESFS